jgi:hypothetical protein
VATLALRAMGEWRTIQHRQESGPAGPRGPAGGTAPGPARGNGNGNGRARPGR